MNEDMFWNASVDELKKAFSYDKENNRYVCLICGEVFEDGVIYEQNDRLYEAKRAIVNHVEHSHGQVIEYLLGLNKKFTGLSELQCQYIKLVNQGLDDKQISEIMKVSKSTVRNYRFKLKEKQKQAKILLSICSLLESNSDLTSNNKLLSIHKGATMIDDRYDITEEQTEKTLKTYFEDDSYSELKLFPAKEKKKLIILRVIAKKFTKNTEYSEKQINDILKPIYHDYATIRRYLIQYGFLERSKDCTVYRIKD